MDRPRRQVFREPPDDDEREAHGVVSEVIHEPRAISWIGTEPLQREGHWRRALSGVQGSGSTGIMRSCLTNTAASLEALIEEERTVSARRRRLHEKIDFLRGTGVDEPESRERLDRLEKEERTVSDRRRELHALIDARRTELGIAPPEREGGLPDTSQGSTFTYRAWDLRSDDDE